MGLSRNKVAVPEGAAGTPPFWRGCLLVDLVDKYLSIHVNKLMVIKINKRTFGSFFFLYSLHSVLYKCRSLEFKAHIKVQALILHFAVFYF